jgi:hypothetical protein
MICRAKIGYSCVEYVKYSFFSKTNIKLKIKSKNIFKIKILIKIIRFMYFSEI